MCFFFSSRLYYPFGKGPGQHIIRCLKNKKCENERRTGPQFSRYFNYSIFAKEGQRRPGKVSCVNVFSVCAIVSWQIRWMHFCMSKFVYHNYNKMLSPGLHGRRSLLCRGFVFGLSQKTSQEHGRAPPVAHDARAAVCVL